MKRIIITADDLGIAPEINRGIIDAHTNGVLRSTALLMNAPYTSEGIKIAKEHPDLETGLHLSIVEGLSLSQEESGVTDTLRYFNQALCLHRDWKHFTLHYLQGKIDHEALKRELDLQFEMFMDHFKTLPFVNGTQHMHLLPGVWTIVKALCIKYKAKGIRLPALSWPNALWFNKRFPFILPFQVLGDVHRRGLKGSGMTAPDHVEGLPFSGQINTKQLLRILDHLPTKGVSEIVMHPGYTSTSLQHDLPWAYTHFNWTWELEALKSSELAETLKTQKIQVIKYAELVA